MSRLDYFTIAIVVVCILAIVFLLYKTTDLFKKDNQLPDQDLTEEGNTYDNTYDDSVIDPADYEDYTLDEADGSVAGESASDSGPNVVFDEGMNGPDEMTSPPKDEIPDSKVPAGNAPATYEKSGEFLVLAGSFSIKANAEAQAKKLQGMGYGQAAVRLFDRGKYAVVLVDRFDDLDRAQDLAAELKGKGTEAVVYKKRGS
ncbi:MAG: SPOR domain-containing protein [Saprospiraceae bacterium]|nr:SPOR domain-containing protein [Saprospiraceae bacterium]